MGDYFDVIEGFRRHGCEHIVVTLADGSTVAGTFSTAASARNATTATKSELPLDSQVLLTILGEPDTTWLESQVQLAKRLGVSQPTVWQAVQGLMRQGYIRRGPPLSGRRGRTYALELTDTGRDRARTVSGLDQSCSAPASRPAPTVVEDYVGLVDFARIIYAPGIHASIASAHEKCRSYVRANHQVSWLETGVLGQTTTGQPWQLCLSAVEAMKSWVQDHPPDVGGWTTATWNVAWGEKLRTILNQLSEERRALLR